MKQLTQTNDYLLLIDEEAEIKENQVFIHPNNALEKASRDLDGRGLSKILAYYPLTKEAKELDLPLLPNPFEEISVEELALKAYSIDSMETLDLPPFENVKNCVEGFIEGYKAAQSKQFSLEDIINFTKWLDKEGIPYEDGSFIKYFNGQDNKVSIEWLFNKYLSSTQQLPKEFMPEYNVHMEAMDMPRIHIQKEVKTLKTKTNSEGKQELVGVYKY